jgi:serine phosphatase RsbU (regulator of sigma subunit)
MAAGDFLFLFTDGFVDQNGGEAGKKLMYTNFEALLMQGVKSDKGLDKMFYDKAFEEWKRDHEQIDDVSLIGVRF